MTDPIRRFYCESVGWSMFDSRRLTPDLKAYLQTEMLILDVIAQQTPRRYDHILEVGCGYGRYLKWALNNGLNYDGVDLVPWLVDMGNARIHHELRETISGHCQIHNLSAEYLDQIRFPSGAQLLTVFPFNCFGNLKNLTAVMNALRNLRCDVFVSLFRSDKTSANNRAAYYEHLGMKNVTVEDTHNGCHMRSSDGYSATAYSSEFLNCLFMSNGFQSALPISLGQVGVGYMFCWSRSNESMNGERRQDARATLDVPITLRLVAEYGQLEPQINFTSANLVSTGKIALPCSTGLLTFDECTAETIDICDQGLLIEVNQRIDSGTIVSIEFSAMESSQVLGLPVLCTGVVQRCRRSTVGKHRAAIKLWRPYPRLFEQLRSGHMATRRQKA